MGTVSPYQGEKTRKEGAAVRSVALGNHAVELIDFHGDKSEPQQKGNGESDQNPLLLAVVRGQHDQTIGYAAEQQEQGFTQQVRQLKQFLPRRSAGIVAAQDGKSSEERRKYDEVAHQIEPEPECLNRDGIGGCNFFVMSSADGRSLCGHHLHLRYRCWDGWVVFGASLGGGQLSIAFIFDALDFGGGNEVMEVVVEGAGNDREQHTQSGQYGQPPDIPDHGESE